MFKKREIKFRIYDKVSKRFVIGLSILEVASYLRLNGLINSNDDNYEIHQFIGRKDDSETDIYEEDVIKAYFPKLGEQICRIRYGIIGFEFEFYPRREFDIPMTINGFPTRAKIIGNTCENPVSISPCEHKKTRLVQGASGNDSWLECLKCGESL